MKGKIKKTASHLDNCTIAELQQGLVYCEQIASGSKNMFGSVMRTIEENKLPPNTAEKERKKMYDIFTEHDNLSFKIELELDRRLKPKFGLKYGAKTLLDTSNAIEAILQPLLKTIDRTKKGPLKPVPPPLKIK